MSTPMEPVFEDPPPPGANRRGDDMWAKTADALIQRSREWARIFVGDSGDAGTLYGRIRNSRGAWQGHEWEATTRAAGKGRESCVHVYARHIRPLGAASDDTPNDEGDEQ